MHYGRDRAKAYCRGRCRATTKIPPLANKAGDRLTVVKVRRRDVLGGIKRDPVILGHHCKQKYKEIKKARQTAAGAISRVLTGVDFNKRPTLVIQ
ncbi:hypothetical protein J6590_059684 [Homalodisca vitripennis]|nr:hypothetical protein J6590_059684 [Homalodisca vitripennis]